MNQPIPPVVRTQMLIRRPVAEVFRAFTDPEVTRRFWFTRGSGVLEEGRTVTWHWDMYGVSVEVAVTRLEPCRRLCIAWPTPVEWTFEARPGDSTLVVITAQGFSGEGTAPVAQALDAMGGFSYALAGCKAFLEHGVELRLSLDHAPDARVPGWS